MVIFSHSHCCSVNFGQYSHFPHKHLTLPVEDEEETISSVTPSWPLVANRRHCSVRGGAPKQECPAVLWKLCRMFHLPNTCLTKTCCKLSSACTYLRKVYFLDHCSWYCPTLSVCSLLPQASLRGERTQPVSAQVYFPLHPLLCPYSATPSRDSWIKFNKWPLTSDHFQHPIQEDQSCLVVI